MMDVRLHFRAVGWRESSTPRGETHTHTHTPHTHIYIYMYVCMEREREREREFGIAKDGRKRGW